MQNIILHDSAHTQDLWPLTATRPVGELRIGILTIREKWEKRWNAKVSYKTADYLQKKFPLTIEEDNFLIDASILPNEELNYLLTCLNTNQFISHESRFVAARLNRRQVESFFQVGGTITDNALELINCKRIQHLWEIFGFNDLELKNDYEILTKDKNSIALHASNQHFGTQLFIEDGAKINASILNSETGPIYISKNAEIMEGAMIRGPFYLGENAQVKMGAKIYGATTIGPGCRVGGEINNSVFYANSNKAHDGFIGNAVI
ncbi:MAG TPA: putative sugar nucleotidyl transferase, partial [Saprospiraceae bacterium]|nr:putative sugar nucleotidyl transferase [Saprospiraceae bacterium]